MPVILITILLAPLAGALLCGFGYRLYGERAALIIATGLLFLTAILSWIVFFAFDGGTETVRLFRFVESGSLTSDWSIRLDRLTAIMLVVVTTVSSLVHLYSFGYMHADPQWKQHESYKPRFFAYLSFFSFAMLALVTSDNLLQLFFGWEGVGVASYLLIGFYYRKPTANAAAIKAFIVNRIGDFGLALGIFALFMLTDSIHFEVIFANAPGLAGSKIGFLWMQLNAAELTALLLFIGACGKSAQLFLHTWLPDAMEGPTPVSALIHAATMVTAGVFLVCRFSPLFEFAPTALGVVAVIGAATAIFAASVGLVQNDIKRVIAYSTCSQLGYMFAAAGCGVYQAAMFHLFTHAFFKALLFLGAGSVIHAMHHEQDMRNYGGLRTRIPWTFWMMLIGTLAITGVGVPLTQFGFAGFLSKDAIVESSFAAGGGAGNFSFWMLVISALMTSFYSWRLMFLTFFGSARGDAHTHAHAHESPWTMLLPILLLAVGSVAAGVIWYPVFFGHYVQDWFGPSVFTAADNHVLEAAHYVPAWVKASPFIAMSLGLALAWLFYIRRTELPARLAAAHRPLYLFLLNKWYFDEIYEFVFVRPAKWIGRFLWQRGDLGVIDGVLHAVALGAVPFLTRLAGRIQSGFLFHYAFVMVAGAALLVAAAAILGGGGG
ncbi:MAG: NADH-quinone oxidoreductase subunit L [Rhodobacteraceae bacterium]|nr:NADH-quinone oxidoreductase subunit L [Paracoccaceae bacterium]